MNIWTDLFPNLDDPSQLNRAINLIKEFDNVYDSFKDGVVTNAKQIEKAIDSNIKQTEEYLEALNKLSPSIEKDRESISKLSKAAEVASEEYKTYNKQLQNSEKNLKKLKKEQDDFNKSAEETLKIHKDTEKLQKRLNDLDSESAKEQARLKIQISEKNKELRESAKESLGLISIYDKEAKRLKELQSRYRDVAVEMGVNSKEAKDLQKEITQLSDEMTEINANSGRNFGQTQGRIADALEGMGGAAGNAAGQVGVLRAGFTKLAAHPIVAVIVILVGLVIKLFDSFKKTAEGSREVEKQLGLLNSIFETIDATIGKVANGLFKIFTGDVSGGIDEISDAFGGFNERLEGNIELQEEYLQLSRATRALQTALIGSQALFNKAITEQSIAEGDVTKSLIEREKASKRLTELEVTRAENALAAARQEERLAAIQLEKEEINGKNLEESQRAFQEAYAARIDAETELLRAREEGGRRTREILQDQFEQELDFLIDSADNQKTINERKIQNDQEALDARFNLLKQTEQLVDESFESQIAAFERLNGVSVDQQKLLSLNNLQLFEYAKQLGFSEIAANRLLEVVRERRIVEQDILELRKELTDEQFKQLDSLDVTAGIKPLEASDILPPQVAKEVEITSLSIAQQLKAGFGNAWQLITSDASRALEAIKKTFLDVFSVIDGFIAIREEKRIAEAEAEIERLETEKENRIRIAGENGEAVLAAEQSFNQKRQAQEQIIAQQKNKAAKREKAAAIITASINTAQAVIAALAPPPTGFGPVLGIPFSIAAGALGAAQIALIAAQPIPQFAKGTMSSPAGLAWVGEQGRELIRTPDGKTFLSDNKPQLVDLPQGSQVMTNAITENILRSRKKETDSSSAAAIEQNANAQGQRVSSLLRKIEITSNQNNERLVGAIEGIEQHQWHFSNGELRKNIRKGNTTYLNVKQENRYGRK